MIRRAFRFALIASGLVASASCSGGGSPPLPPPPPQCGLDGEWSIQGIFLDPPEGSCVPLGLESFVSRFTFFPTEDPGTCVYTATAPGLEGPPEPLLDAPLIVVVAPGNAQHADVVAVDGLYYQPAEDVTVALSWPAAENLDSTLATDGSAFESVIEYHIYAGYEIVQSTDEQGDDGWDVAQDAESLCEGLLRLEAQRTIPAITAAPRFQFGVWTPEGAESLGVSALMDEAGRPRWLTISIPEERMHGAGTIELPLPPGAECAQAHVERTGRTVEIALLGLRACDGGIEGWLSVADSTDGRELAGPLRTDSR